MLIIGNNLTGSGFGSGANIPAGEYTEIEFINLIKTFISPGATRQNNVDISFIVKVTGGGNVRWFRTIRMIKHEASSTGSVAGRTTSSTWLRFSNVTSTNYQYSDNGSTWVNAAAWNVTWSQCLSGLPPSSTGYSVNLQTDINFL